MRSTVINTSKEMMCYSDFPIPKEYPIYMHNTYVQKYFNLYVEKFNLKKYINFGHEVEMYFVFLYYIYIVLGFNMYEGSDQIGKK